MNIFCPEIKKSNCIYFNEPILTLICQKKNLYILEELQPLTALPWRPQTAHLY